MTMHATITDQKALSEVPYDRLIAFLEREGFTKTDNEEAISRFESPTHGMVYIFSPMCSWWGTRMGGMIEDLSIIMDRSQLDIYADIMGFRWVQEPKEQPE